MWEISIPNKVVLLSTVCPKNYYNRKVLCLHISLLKKAQ
jgi:hypothetical protein